MKNTFMRISSFCLAAVAGMLLFACNPTPDSNEPEPTPKPEPETEFSVEIKEVGADFIELSVSSPAEVEMAYMVSELPQALSPVVLFAKGTTLTVKHGDVVKITEGIVQETTYNLYAVAKLDAQNYSKVTKLEFTTEKYQFTDLITIVDTYYDGYKAHITIPAETKERGHVIRAGSMPLAYYNLMTSSQGTAAIDLMAIASQGDPYSGHMFNDSTIVINDDNVVLLDKFGEPVLDENGEMFDVHNPLAPGEPTIMFAGECRYGSKEDFNDVVGYYQPERDSWSVPYYDRETQTWLGAFEKKEFFTKQPTLCDCTVNVEIPEDEITVTDAMVYFDADDDVARYFYMILDNGTYNSILSSYLDNHEEWFQWFLTSYIAFMEWGIFPETTDTYTNAAAKFVEPLTGGDTYHVLVTVMGDDRGATQRFIHKTFTAKEKTMLPPVLEVKAVNTGDPYLATFNIKAPNKDVVGSYWACNYAREFEVMFNAKYTYADLLKGNYTFTSDELALINSDEGYTVSFPTIDGEVTRFAAYGCNVEYTFNNINPEVEGQGWADYRAPMAEKKNPVSSPLYAALEGDWTATATVIAKEKLEDGTEVSRNLTHSSKVTISSAAPYVPEVMDESIYALYQGKDKDEVDGMYEELQMLTDQFTEYRLEGQNRLLCTGFVDFDYYKNPGRMDIRTPYDLFTATDYVSIDVAQAVYDFGPKWYLEVLEDGSVIVPFNSTYLPPMHNWTIYAKYQWEAYSFYVGGAGDGMGVIDASDLIPGFPVEIASDMNSFTIKPIVLSDGGAEQKLYMNALGIDPQNPTGLEIIATVISDIVFTRGWDEPAQTHAAPNVTPSKLKAVTMTGAPVSKLPEARTYKSMTKLEVKPAAEYQMDETPNVVTMEMVEKASAKILKHYNIQ